MLKSTCVLVDFVVINTYRLTEVRNFKTFLKDVYETVFDSYCGIEHGVLIALIEFAYIYRNYRHS